jgi:hypothetical protein
VFGKPYLLAAISAMALAVTGLAACGSSANPVITRASSTGDANGVVAQVGNSSITRATLNHWMATIVGGDYDENLGHPAPRGLVADPPNYPACVSAIETLGPAKTTEAPPQARAALESDCHQLYQSLKQQALSYLIKGLWSLEEAAEEGIHITSAEINRSLVKLKAERYPSDAAFEAYLAGREWSLSDELYLVKRDLLTAKLEARHERALRKTTKGGQLALQRALIERYVRDTKRWTAKTSCVPEYVVAECAQYKGSEATGPSPDALLEQITASR